MHDAEKKKAEFLLDKNFENQGIPPAESAKKSFRWIPRSAYMYNNWPTARRPCVVLIPSTWFYQSNAIRDMLQISISLSKFIIHSLVSFEITRRLLIFATWSVNRIFNECARNSAIAVISLLVHVRLVSDRFFLSVFKISLQGFQKF